MSDPLDFLMVEPAAAPAPAPTAPAPGAQAITPELERIFDSVNVARRALAASGLERGDPARLALEAALGRATEDFSLAYEAACARAAAYPAPGRAVDAADAAEAARRRAARTAAGVR